MKQLINHIIFIIAVGLFLQSCTEKRTMPDMKETYSYKDNNPFGGSMAYNMLRNAYPGKTPQLIKDQFADNYQWDYDTGAVYFNVSRNFYLKDRDAEDLLSFVYRGNTAFISAENFDTILLEKLYCKEAKNTPISAMLGNWYMNTSVGFVPSLSLYKDSFSYYYYPFDNSFSEINSSYSRKAGENAGGKTNFFVFMWGKGRLYFHNEPRALSNYFLLTGNNYRYLQEILQMFPARPEKLYWDNYHSGHNYREGDDDDNSFSTFGTIMKYPSLARAFWIALVLLLLYIFFNSKRRQRIIPVVKPVENTSIAFAEAIAGMYLSKKDNKLIAEKAITYFNEHIRTKYFMSMSIHEPGYADMLSRKSGVPAEITEQLTNTITNISASEKVSDQELLLLNGLIEKFFKNKT